MLAPLHIREPEADKCLPLLFDSPHSGTIYPDDFGYVAPLSRLRQAEDTHVDDLWSGAADSGATLIAANFPRSYIDCNRDLADMDPLLLAEVSLPSASLSSKVRMGKGLIWRLLDDGTPIYSRRLSRQEVQHRIHTCYTPYHQAVTARVDALLARFGGVWHINCHSMPSVSDVYTSDQPGKVHADIVLGDRDGTTCEREFVELVSRHFSALGYRVAYNDPYKGVELVRRNGHPMMGMHSLQLEINRKLYMDEHTLLPTPNYGEVKADIESLMRSLAAFVGDRMRSRGAASRRPLHPMLRSMVA